MPGVRSSTRTVTRPRRLGSLVSTLEFVEDDDESSEPEDAVLPSESQHHALPTKALHQKRRRKRTVPSKPPLNSEFDIAEDTAIFNAVRSARGGLNAVVEAWTEEYLRGGEADEGEQSRGSAIASLVNAVLRSCGCNATVDQHEALDLDAITDSLDAVQDEFKKVPNKAYPLIARSKPWHRVRLNLVDFFSRLLQACHASEVLYDSTFCNAVQSWLVAMSSSPIRAFRHTATVVSLSIVADLASLLDEVTRDVASLGQRVATERRGRKDKARAQAWELKQVRAHGRKQTLEGFIGDFFDGVFVHRYRDADPGIRVECVRALETWMHTNPVFFVENAYLRYVGWMLTDKDAQARHEAARALSALYRKEDNIPAMRHFTERFRGRLLEIATTDPAAAVRVQAINVLSHIDRHGLLEDEQRQKLSEIIFEDTASSRAAVAPFVASLLQEKFEDLRAQGGSTGESKRKRPFAIGERPDADRLLRVKCLATFLASGQDSDPSSPGNAQPSDTGGSCSTRLWQPSLFAASPIDEPPSRGSAAVNALWDVDVSVQDHEGILELLLSSADGDAVPVGRSGHDVDEVCWLTPREGLALMEVLVESCRRAANARAVADDGDIPERNRNPTSVLMQGLPRLLTRYQGDATRVALLLQLPAVMDLGQYLEARKMTALDSLWIDIIGVYLQHTDHRVHRAALATFRSFIKEESLKPTTDAKLEDLEHAVFASLHDLVQERDVETVTLDEDDVTQIEDALARIAGFLSLRPSQRIGLARDGAAPLELIEGLSSRGELGYHGEDNMVVWALRILSNTFLWTVARINTCHESDVATLKAALHFRERLFSRLRSYLSDATGVSCSNIQDVAFVDLMNLHVACGGQGVPESIRVVCDEQTQYRAAGFVQAHVARLEGRPTDGTSSLVLDNVFATFTRAICLGVIDIRHASCLLPHYGRFGLAFDRWVQLLIQALRDNVFLERRSADVSNLISLALRESLEVDIAGDTTDDVRCVALSRLFQTAVVVRGPQLSIACRMDAAAMIRLHTTCLRWAVNLVASLADSLRADAAAKRKAIFDALLHLTVGLQGPAALEIKTALERIIVEEGRADAEACRASGPFRRYMKRLTSIMTKDPTMQKPVRETGPLGDDIAQDFEAPAGVPAEGDRTSEPSSGEEGTHPSKRGKWAHKAEGDERASSPESEISITEAKRRRRRAR